MENHNGPVVDVDVRPAHCRAEREAALGMVANLAGDQRVSVGPTRTMTPRRATEARELKATPHVAQNNNRRRSAIDRRTDAAPGL